MIRAFFAALACIAALDLLFVGVIARSLFKTVPGFRSSLGAQHWVAVAGIWVLLALAVVLFALPGASDIWHAIGKGALLGLVVYGVYELTNFALLSNWPLKVVLVDSTWGAVLLGAASIAGTLAK